MRTPQDYPLVHRTIQVQFFDKTTDDAIAEGNNAGWRCKCGEILTGRCYYQFGDTCYTVCRNCQRKYRVERDEHKKASCVKEFK